ncbi:TetR/AcrR family transcriptional regulator [Xanthomonas phaseoli]|uniref:TetR/AcrR family transcriptional regulator n=1 Tax=Xanthomonas phaseoli TaxID=1985254 RepID=UPI001E3D5E0C|nr:TetR/AcrR family transcriptional regulator [Xanthomonas phaseoli]MCC8471602.1 TetR/AcrR family transcriptional regulator [Xanthomonas phaseoli]
MKVVKQKSKGGRPPPDKAGDVDRRLLDAALQLFLERGFEHTSCEDIARLAGAGKASLYARYANKDAIFEAVIRRDVQTQPLPAASSAPLDLEGRLRLAGRAILAHALQPQTVAMMRLVVGTSIRAPELAAEVNRIGWEGGLQRVRMAILDGPDQPADPSALASHFVDLVFAPHQLRALLGEHPASLVDSAADRVEWALGLLSAAGQLKTKRPR